MSPNYLDLKSNLSYLLNRRFHLVKHMRLVHEIARKMVIIWHYSTPSKYYYLNKNIKLELTNENESLRNL